MVRGPTGSLGWELPPSYVFWSLQTGEGFLMAGGPDFFSISLFLVPVSLLFSTPLSVLPSIFLSLPLCLCVALSLCLRVLSYPIPVFLSLWLYLLVSDLLVLHLSGLFFLFFCVSWPLCAGHGFLSFYSGELRGMRRTSFKLRIPPIVGTYSSS